MPKSPIRRFVGSPAAECRRRRTLAWYAHGYHMLLRDLEGPLVTADVASWVLSPGAPLPSGADRGATRGVSAPRRASLAERALNRCSLSLDPPAAAPAAARQRHAGRGQGARPSPCLSARRQSQVRRRTAALRPLEDGARDRVVGSGDDRGRALVGLEWRIGSLVGAFAMIGDLFSSFASAASAWRRAARRIGLDQIPEVAVSAARVPQSDVADDGRHGGGRGHFLYRGGAAFPPALRVEFPRAPLLAAISRDGGDAT